MIESVSVPSECVAYRLGMHGLDWKATFDSETLEIKIYIILIVQPFLLI